MLVFEYVEGGDLQRLLMRKEYRNRGLPVSQVIDIAEQLLLAVDHIHSLGYLHRDLKPGNILVGREGSRFKDGQFIKGSR